jgi:S1-C subfamily serine protease
MLVVVCGALAVSCAAPPAVDSRLPGREVRVHVARRVAAVVVTDESDLRRWVRGGFDLDHAPDDADGGSATPISGDGYFLTADHVLERVEGRNVFVLFAGSGGWVSAAARIVWRSPRADLALLHVAVPTPRHYRWTTPGRWLPAGTGVMHGGIATGMSSDSGRLESAIPPEHFLGGYRRFKIDIPLQPGDSGGPVVDADGDLVGINSAVEFLVPMETAFFIDSEANRPHLGSLASVISADRRRRGVVPP